MVFITFHFTHKENKMGKEEYSTLHKGLQFKKELSTFTFGQETSILSKTLRTILLQDNLLTEFPRVLSSRHLFPSLRVVQIHGNPIEAREGDKDDTGFGKLEGMCYQGILQ